MDETQTPTEVIADRKEAAGSLEASDVLAILEPPASHRESVVSRATVECIQGTQMKNEEDEKENEEGEGPHLVSFTVTGDELCWEWAKDYPPPDCSLQLLCTSSRQT